MFPTRDDAERLLEEGERLNPGPWANHCRVVAHCAECIARACDGMDADKAYVLGLLHDIGRRFGTRQLGHVSDGYSYMMSLGYDEVAQICLTHSFEGRSASNYVGAFDTTDEELELINLTLEMIQIDDYDRLIRLCDAISGADGVMYIEERMEDVRNRYGRYPQSKWDSNIELKEYFEEWARVNLYDLVGMDVFRPRVVPDCIV